MQQKLFFSWQKDTPPEVGMNFIEEALRNALTNAGADLEIEEAIRNANLVIDRDTKGVAGQPPIVDTIFGKIDEAAIFLSDLTFVGARLDERPTPNPNVCIEHGWALKSLSYRLMISVMNTAYGKPDEKNLPFDIRHMRWPIQYMLPEDSDTATRTAVRKELAKDLRKAIAAIIESRAYIERIGEPEVPASTWRPSSDMGGPYFRSAIEPIGKRQLFPGAVNKDDKVIFHQAPAIWLRMKPAHKLDVELSVAKIKAVIEADSGCVMNFRMVPNGTNYVTGPDGAGIFYAANVGGPADMLTYIFKSGEIWGLDALSIGYAGNIIPAYVEGTMRETFERYLSLMKSLDIEAPYDWMAGFDQIQDLKMHIPYGGHGANSFSPPVGECFQPSLQDGGRYKKGQPIAATLNPLFQRLYEIFVVNRPDQLNAA